MAIEIKKVILQGMEDSIPKVKCGDGKNRKVKPIWMTAKAFKKIKKKYRLFKRFLATEQGSG